MKQWNAAALRICLESNVTEILREAGPGVCLRTMRCLKIADSIPTGNACQRYLGYKRHR